MDYQELIEEIYEEVKHQDLKGTVADYIPELAEVDGSKFGLALVDLDGKVYGAGDSKVHTLTMVFHVFKSKLWSRVNVEPSGNPFNSIAQLEYEKGIPRNPFINAGALVITDALVSKYKNPIQNIIEYVDELAGIHCVRVNQKVKSSELAHSQRNTAMAYFLKAHGNFENSVDEVIDTYVSQCAIEMSCEELAKTFSFLANNGYSVFAKKQILSETHVKRINALMLTCGFYDESGEFAFRVGMPGKSGVGGGIGAIMPGKFSIGVWSPELNEKGNPIKAIKAMELLTTKLNFSLF
jgi:glutaminase